ncbi:MAG: hypothetical protein GX351_00455 [Peptococcaceae bacterium]|jgi:hypothetical protein|nr:hypothetical protein [Peptococcaceae bacterium]
MYDLMVYFILVIFWLSAIAMALSNSGIIQEVSSIIFTITSPLALLGIFREIFKNKTHK